MVKRLYTTMIFILSCKLLFAQADCVIFFKYRGIVTSDSLKIEKAAFPTTPFLIGYIEKSEERAFAIFNITDSTFNLTLASHLSSDFCRDQTDIINDVFKKKKEYIIKIFEFQNGKKSKAKIHEIIIPIESIKFTSETIDNKKEIVVDLGHIRV
jgi:hypothetical protein